MLGKIASGGGDTIATADKTTQIQKVITEYDKLGTLGIDLSNAPVVGDKNAPVTIVKFHDYNCGHCMHASKILAQILSSYSGIVKIVYKNFPLDGTCNRLVGRVQPGGSSCVAASASICANDQGKFYPVYESLFVDNEKGVMHSASSVMEIARKTGLDVEKFNQCMASPRTRNLINKDVADGEKLKIDSTPSLFVNDKRIPSGTPDIDFLKSLIDHLAN